MGTSFFSRGPKVGAPVLTPTAVNVPFSHANLLVVQPPLMPGQGDPSSTILRILNEIWAVALGQQFLTALQAAGKQIGIRYAGPNNNQAAGAARGYVLLRMYHDANNAAGFGRELQAGITALQHGTGHDLAWVANQLYRQEVPTWQGGTIRPFGRPVIQRTPPTPGNPRPQPMTPPQAIQAMLTQWIAGNGLPSRDEADAIMLVLKDHLNPGPGVATRINFDPHKEIVNGRFRPPHVGLFHELMHAYYNSLGRQLGREDSLNEGNGGRLFEVMAVGMGPFATAQFSENGFRAALGVAARTTYP